MVLNEQKKALFECHHTGLKAVYVGTKDAEAPNVNKDAKRVVYIPLKDLNKEGIIDRWKGVKSYKKLWQVTNTKYPKDALIGPKPVAEPNNEEGLFDTMVVAAHDIRGQANYLENFVGKSLEHRLDEKEARIKELEKQLGNKELEKLTQGDQSEVEDDDNKRGRRGRDRMRHENRGIDFDQENW